MKEQIESTAVKSTAALAGHPIHPMLIPFPVAFLLGAVLTDVAFVFTGNEFWAGVSYWLILGGFVLGGLAGVIGMIDFFTIPRARNLFGWAHGAGNITTVILALVNFLLRVNNPVQAILPEGIILSFVIGAILLVTAWLGGELAYRYEIGVNPRQEVLRSSPPDLRKAA